LEQHIMKSDAGQLAALSLLGGAVLANRNHRITGGRADHDEVRAARVAAAARRRGMTYSEIADAMHLMVEDIHSWLGPGTDALTVR
jgi:hypothetical protein